MIPQLDGRPPGGSVLDGGARPQVEIVVPVKDEERDLDPSIRRLVGYLRSQFPFTARITIADNGSADHTWPVAKALCREFVEVGAVHLDQPGRGRTLRAVWSASMADVLAYMDVDLSTDLNALLPLVAPLLSGHSDVAIGTRLARGSRVIRGPRREVISRCYNLLLHTVLRTRFSDAQCGFKAIRRQQAKVLLPLTEDTGWFFDTELLVLAERAGLRIHEVPVDWTDDADSRVDIMATALADLRGIAKLGTALLRGKIKVPAPRPTGALARPVSQSSGGPGQRWSSGTPGRLGQRSSGALGRQLTGFVVVGAACTVAYLLLYLVLRTAMPALAANAISLLITAVANTAANRRFTFGIRGRAHAAGHQAKGLIAFATGLALTSAALAGLHAVSARPGVGWELAVLAGANLTATALRFLLFRTWVFGGGGQPTPRQPECEHPNDDDPAEPDSPGDHDDPAQRDRPVTTTTQPNGSAR
jgi:putative flippase GtrA